MFITFTLCLIRINSTYNTRIRFLLKSTTNFMTTTTSRGTVDDDKGDNSTKSKPKPLVVGLVSYCVGDAFTELQELVSYNHRAYADIIMNSSRDDDQRQQQQQQAVEVRIFQGNQDSIPYESFITPRAWVKGAYLYHLLSSSQSTSSSSMSMSSSSTSFSNSLRTDDVDWFLWLDCDALIARFDLSIAALLEELQIESHHQFIVAVDKQPKPKQQKSGSEKQNNMLYSPFNTGVMLIRNSTWSKQLFHNLLQLAQIDTIRNHPWWEQYGLHTLYNTNLHQEQYHIKILPERTLLNAFSGINDYTTSDYIPNYSFVWHRAHCRNYDCCMAFTKSFFCTIMPKELLSSSSSSSSSYYSYPTDVCDNVPQWIPPSETNHCREQRQRSSKREKATSRIR